MRLLLVFLFCMAGGICFSQQYYLSLFNSYESYQWNIDEGTTIYYSFEKDTGKVYKSKVEFIGKDKFSTARHVVYPDSLHYIGSFRSPNNKYDAHIWAFLHIGFASSLFMVMDNPIPLFIPIGIAALITKSKLNYRNRYGYLKRESELSIKSR